MSKLFFPILVVMLISCKSNVPSPISTTKESELRTFFLENYKKVDSSIKLDSFRFLKLDTISLKAKYVFAAARITDKIESISSEMKLNNSRIESELQMMRLSRGLLEATYENSKENANKYIEENKALGVKGKALQTRQDSLFKLAETADSIKPVGYQAICLYQIRFKDMSIKKDTAYIVLNHEKNIVKREDFYGEKDDE